MAKSGLSAAEKEALAMKELDQEALAELDPNNPDNFNIVAGKPIPSGFKNPEPGQVGRFCLDLEGNYNPRWVQLKIDKTREKQRDPQTFPLGKRWGIPLDKWVDAPPEVIIALQDAIETHHETTYSDDSVKLGIHPEIMPIERKRFFWSVIASA